MRSRDLGHFLSSNLGRVHSGIDCVSTGALVASYVHVSFPELSWASLTAGVGETLVGEECLLRSSVARKGCLNCVWFLIQSSTDKLPCRPLMIHPGQPHTYTDDQSPDAYPPGWVSVAMKMVRQTQHQVWPPWMTSWRVWRSPPTAWPATGNQPTASISDAECCPCYGRGPRNLGILLACCRPMELEILVSKQSAAGLVIGAL